MKKIFTLGRENGNDITINKPMLSKRHIEIEVLDDNRLLIKDLNTTNGTFVVDNDGEKRRIKSKIIKPHNQIYLGSYFLDAEKLFTKIKEKRFEGKTDFSKEFLELKQSYENFEIKRDKLMKKYKTKPLLIRFGLTIVVMIAIFFIKPLKEYRYYLITGIGLVAGLSSSSTKSGKDYRIKLEKLELELVSKYKCPKCNNSIPTHKSWSYYREIGKCPKCGAKWA